MTLSKIIFSPKIWLSCSLILLGISCQFQPSLLLLNVLVAILLTIAFSLMFNRGLFAIFLTTALGVLLQLLNDLKKALWFQDLEAVDIYYLLNIGSIKLGSLLSIYLGFREFALISFFIISLFLLWYYSKPLFSIRHLGTLKFLTLRVFNIFIALVIFTSSLKVLTDPSHKMTSYLTDYYTKVVQKRMPGFYPLFWQNGFSRKFGPFAALLLGMPDSSLSLPIHRGTRALIDSLLAQRKTQPAKNLAKQDLPNIIMILNESTFNPIYLDYPFAKELRFSFFDHDQYTKFSGLMNVNTFGGNSSISEFEVSTGIKSNYLGNIGRYPFLYLVNLTRQSLFKTLKTLGYKTIVLYPLSKSFVNADHGYHQLGADEVLDIFDFGLTEGEGQHIGDDKVFSMITKTVSKHKNEPLFIFAATLSNHGPHASNFMDKIGCAPWLEKNTCSKLNDYISRLTATNKDLLQLTDTLMRAKQKTLLINFGDHMPSFEGQTKNLKFTAASGMQTLYRTFYNVRANFTIDNIASYKTLDITFIPGLILDIVGYDDRGFYAANSLLRNACQGEIRNCIASYPELVDSYRALELEQLTAEPQAN